MITTNGSQRQLTSGLYRNLQKLKVKVNSGKTKVVDLERGDTFSFLGFVYRRVKSAKGKWAVAIVPKIKARTALLRKLKEIFRRFVSQPVSRIIYLINPILRGWVNYFRIGHCSKCFGYVKGWASKEGKKTTNACKKTAWFWLEQVE